MERQVTTRSKARENNTHTHTMKSEGSNESLFEEEEKKYFSHRWLFKHAIVVLKRRKPIKSNECVCIEVQDDRMNQDRVSMMISGASTCLILILVLFFFSSSQADDFFRTEHVSQAMTRRKKKKSKTLRVCFLSLSKNNHIGTESMRNNDVQIPRDLNNDLGTQSITYCV